MHPSVPPMGISADGKRDIIARAKDCAEFIETGILFAKHFLVQNLSATLDRDRQENDMSLWRDGWQWKDRRRKVSWDRGDQWNRALGRRSAWRREPLYMLYASSSFVDQSLPYFAERTMLAIANLAGQSSRALAHVDG